MKKFIFYSIPVHGHTNPTINVARELVKKGNKVIYYSIEEFRDRIESAGIEFRCYNMDRYFDPILARDLALMARKLIHLSAIESAFLLEEAEKEKADCVIHDSFSLWGKIVGSSLNIPTISLFTTFAFNSAIVIQYTKMYMPVIQAFLRGKNSIPAITEYINLCKRYKISIDKSTNFLLAKGNMNLVFTSRYLQPCSNSFDKTFKFIGPSIYPRHEDASFLKKLNKNKNIIYLSMGTIFNDNLHFFQQCISLLSKTNYQVIISLGHRLSKKQFLEIPPNILVKNHVPQLDVLQKASLFISHAGMNSINESLYYGVPMVLIPQMYEQAFNAYRVQELGAGIYLKSSQATPQKILQCIDKVITTTSYYKNAKKIQNTLKEAGGYKKAAEEILTYIK